jgi:leader peptidase (prepilin peptidase)/N-methyltransferase
VTSDPVLMAIYWVILFCLGLIIGSFLNVVIYRVPIGKSIVRPASACPGCRTQIAARDNIPVVSWLLLRGRCRSCGERISARYPLVELGTALLWVGLGWWALTPEGINPLLPLLLVLGSAGVALAMIDLDQHRLPDAIVMPLYPVTAVGLAFAGIVSGQWPWAGALVGAAVWMGLMGALWLFSGGRAMGFGDVKLSPVLGVTLGWVAIASAVVGLFVAFILGAVVGVILIARRKAGRGSRVPFGPFLLMGAAVGLLVGESLGTAYLDMVGL